MIQTKSVKKNTTIQTNDDKHKPSKQIKRRPFMMKNTHFILYFFIVLILYFMYHFEHYVNYYVSSIQIIIIPMLISL